MKTRFLAQRRSIVALASLALLPHWASAENFPERPIKIVVPLAPGGINDAAVRLLAARLGEKLKSPVIVENRPGAGAVPGTQFVARASADGYTLLHAQPTAFTVNPNVMKDLPYNVQKDFVPIAPVYTVPIVMLARAEFPASTLDEVIEMAKKQPSSIVTASYGIGTGSHFILEWLRTRTGAELLHVPYKGVAAATLALLSGEASLSFDALPGALPHLKSGKLKALAVMQNNRASAAPGIATTRSARFAELDLPGWGGIFAPAGTPPQRVRFLTDAINAIVADERFAEQLTQMGADVYRGTPSDLAQRVNDETEKIRKIISEAKLTFEK